MTECRVYQVIPVQNGALLRADPASTVASPVCARAVRPAHWRAHYTCTNTHSQFNIFRALRREPRGQKPPNKAGQVSEWGRPDPQNKPWEDHQGVSASKPRKTLF